MYDPNYIERDSTKLAIVFRKLQFSVREKGLLSKSIIKGSVSLFKHVKKNHLTGKPLNYPFIFKWRTTPIISTFPSIHPDLSY